MRTDVSTFFKKEAESVCMLGGGAYRALVESERRSRRKHKEAVRCAACGHLTTHIVDLYFRIFCL